MSRGSGTREATEERFAQRAARVRGQRARRWLVLLLVIGLLVGLGWLVGFSSVLATREVEVTGADPADRAEIEQIAQEQVGTPLARVDGDGVSRTITAEVPGAAHATVERDWPHTLKVKVTSRVPALAVRLEGDRFRLLDLDGRQLLPGLWDEHVHVRTWAVSTRRIDVRSATGPEEVAARVRAAGGWLHLDAVQAAGKLPIRWTEIEADTLSLSAHKFGGPQGVGALDAQERFMQTLSARGKLDRKVEGLPNDARMREMTASGTPLSRPEIAVLTAYGKLELSDDIVASSAPGVVIETVKLAEDRSGDLVVRLYESRGERAHTTLTVDGEIVDQFHANCLNSVAESVLETADIPVNPVPGGPCILNAVRFTSGDVAGQYTVLEIPTNRAQAGSGPDTVAPAAGTLDEPHSFDDVEHREGDGRGERVGCMRGVEEESPLGTTVFDLRARHDGGDG